MFLEIADFERHLSHRGLRTIRRNASKRPNDAAVSPHRPGKSGGSVPRQKHSAARRRSPPVGRSEPAPCRGFPADVRLRPLPRRALRLTVGSRPSAHAYKGVAAGRTIPLLALLPPCAPHT